ncbi:uncharacterized protein [Narcine bancroftii]|uniref:uncharacterized protein n=1 Tax=Narcine bancroftii TaxID=1343680 RepID=UPI0038316BC4
MSQSLPRSRADVLWKFYKLGKGGGDKTTTAAFNRHSFCSLGAARRSELGLLHGLTPPPASCEGSLNRRARPSHGNEINATKGKRSVRPSLALALGHPPRVPIRELARLRTERTGEQDHDVTRRPPDNRPSRRPATNHERHAADPALASGEEEKLLTPTLLDYAVQLKRFSIHWMDCAASLGRIRAGKILQLNYTLQQWPLIYLPTYLRFKRKLKHPEEAHMVTGKLDTDRAKVQGRSQIAGVVRKYL